LPLCPFHTDLRQPQLQDRGEGEGQVTVRQQSGVIS
jgi:hypothetical protein